MGIKTFAFPILIVISLVAYSAPVFAHCPLCTAATGAVVATTRVIGIDDIVVGTFIGAFTISTAFWIGNVINKRLLNRKKSAQSKGLEYVKTSMPYALSAVFLIFTIVGFYFGGLLDPMYNYYIWGVQKLVAGMIIGTIVTIAAFDFHRLIRRANNNKNYFPMQGIILPLIALAAVDVFMYIAGVAI